MATHRTGSGWDLPQRLGVHRRHRHPDPPPLDLPNLRTDQRQSGCTENTVPRPSAHPRHPSDQSRRTRQSGQRTTRTREPSLHNRHLPTRLPRHASRSRPRIRTAHWPRRLERSKPVEAPEEDRLNTIKALVRQPSDQGFLVAGAGRGLVDHRSADSLGPTGLRSLDETSLNPRPSGYEPDEGVPDSV